MTAPIEPTQPTTEPTGATPPAPTEPPVAKPEEGLGDGGKKALQAERDARKALERQIAALAPLQKLAEALGAGTPDASGKTEVELLNERFAQHEKDLTEERMARFRLEVAGEKKLSVEQAAWLKGSTREELAVSADQLLAAFPATAAKSGTPAPDPSQGSRGGAPDVEAKIAAAQAKGDWRTVISLQNEKLTNSF